MKTNPDSTVISPVAPALRILYLAIAAVTGAATFISRSADGFGIAGPLVTAFCLLASAYEERWKFDHASRQLEFCLGLRFIHSRRVWGYDEISGVEATEFVKGLGKESWTRITVELRDGRNLVIDSVKTKKAARLIGIAVELDSLFRKGSSRE